MYVTARWYVAGAIMEGARVGSGRVPRTANPAGAPYTWQDHVEGDGERVTENELDACLQAGCRTQADYDICIEQVAARKRRAAAGKLHPPDDEEATPVRIEPLLWEIRWDFGGRLLRLYHAEPRVAPRALLALVYHWKRTTGMTQPAIDAEQEDQMLEAGRRYRRSSFHPGDGESD